MSSNDVNPNPLEGMARVSRLMLVCCYLYGLLGAVAFLNREPYKRDRAMRFHSFQSIMFFGLWILLRLVSFLSPLASQMGGRIEIGLLLIWIFLMISTYRGKTIKLPLIGEWAEKKAG